MPSNNRSAISTLKEKLAEVSTGLSDEELFAILENRREIIARLMKNFSNEELGNICCLSKDGSSICHSLGQDSPIVHGEKFSLKTRGVFAGTPTARIGSTCKTFGVDRDGNWLLIEIAYSQSGKPPTQKAEHVYVQAKGLYEVVEGTKIHPLEIWLFFKIIIDNWVSERKRLYEQALAIQAGAKEEELAFSLLNRIFP